AFVVPLLDDGSTVLVRQWRYPWRETSWEVPAGTLEEGEDPLAGARRELEEEAGLRAAEWTPLGVLRPSALLDSRQFLFLARGAARPAGARGAWSASGSASCSAPASGRPPCWRAGRAGGRIRRRRHCRSGP